MQGESESLTGPQTSCQGLLIRAERHKECTRPPALELAGQSAERESEELKEESLLWGWWGDQAGSILIRTILAICVTVTRPPLGDAVPVVTLEVGGLTGVIDGCQQKRRETVNASRVFTPINHRGAD